MLRPSRSNPKMPSAAESSSSRVCDSLRSSWDWVARRRSAISSKARPTMASSSLPVSPLRASQSRAAKRWAVVTSRSTRRVTTKWKKSQSNPASTPSSTLRCTTFSHT